MSAPSLIALCIPSDRLLATQVGAKADSIKASSPTSFAECSLSLTDRGPMALPPYPRETI